MFMATTLGFTKSSSLLVLIIASTRQGMGEERGENRGCFVQRITSEAIEIKLLSRANDTFASCIIPASQGKNHSVALYALGLYGLAADTFAYEGKGLNRSGGSIREQFLTSICFLS